MKKYITTAFMLFSLVAAANSSIKVEGSLDFILDHSIETDGNQWFSMNGQVFGPGDWKQSTNDNWNDNRDKFQAILNLRSEIKVNDRVKINLGFESMVDELNGKLIGSGESINQEFASVMDNPPIILKDITAEIDSDFAKITLTNNFNYNFNRRVLASQFEDNNNNYPMPYGEGILLERTILDAPTRAFVYQASEGAISPDSARDNGVNVNGHNDYTNEDKVDTRIIYGFDFQREFALGILNFLLVNEHNRSTEVEGDNFEKKLNNHWIAIGGEVEITPDLILEAEYITAIYGKDVEEILNSFGQASWDENSYALNGRSDSDILDISTTYNVTNDLQLKLGYKSVGENYIAVLGNSQKKDSWMGQASFDASGGLGYEEGYNAEINYVLPFDLLVKTKLEYKNYDLTRSAFGSNEDTNEQELKGTIDITEDRWRAEASYRRRTLNNSGSGTVAKTDLLYNSYNFNGSYTLIQNPTLETKINLDLNYYTGDDHTIKQNFSNESRIKIGTNSEYRLSDSVTLMGSYNFGYATEDNNVVSGSAMQNMVTMGMRYRVTDDVIFNLFYKYDNYRYDLDATAEQLTNSVHKKEAEYRWYDGLESWDHSGADWNAWKWTIPENYKGYETHQVKASVTIRF